MGWVRISSIPTAPRNACPTVGRVEVAFYRGERPDVEQTARRLFGRRLRPREYAGLAGAPDDALVDVGTLDGGLYLETRDPVTNCYHGVQHVRFVHRALVVVIDAFHILRKNMRRKGLGLSILSRQLHYAKSLDVRRIETTAGRIGDENGYYTWPRFGFNGPLPLEVKRNLPPGLAHAESVLDLIERDDGRLWWSHHGIALDVAFDMADRSRCWRVLRQYLREKLLRRDTGVLLRG